jgi:hypothetical protein
MVSNRAQSPGPDFGVCVFPFASAKNHSNAECEVRNAELKPNATLRRPQLKPETQNSKRNGTTPWLIKT